MIGNGAKASASVTVYFCLCIAIVAGLILALLEAVRYEGLNTDAKEWSDFAVESLCAGYQPVLFEEYEMFLFDAGFGDNRFSIEKAEEETEALLYDNLQWLGKEGMNFYRMGIRGVSVTEYTLLTDDKGNVFTKYAADIMQKQIGKRAAEALLKQITDIQSAENADVNIEGSIDDARQKLLEIEQEKQAQEAANQTETSGDEIYTKKTRGSNTVETSAANPLEDVTPLREQGIWTLAVPSGKTVSNKAISVDNSLERRIKQQGTNWKKYSVSWYDRILMQEYFKPLGGNFAIPDEAGALSYGMEYLIWGENSDEENLKKTVNSLLLLREAANYMYLQTDSVKQAEALSAATVLAGATANPAVIEVVKQGLLAAWAYAESVLDVRVLLSGGKIPIKKTAANWQTGLSSLGNVGNQSYTGEAQGMTYENYLDAFVYGKANQTVAYRMMDLMEQKLQQQNGYADCRMDYMVTAIRIETEYAADTVFSGIFDRDILCDYTFYKQADYIYQ